MRDPQAFQATTALTAAALLVHGYHPYGEDGGVYAAGIKKLLHPELFPYWTDFVTEHLRFSLFAPLIACLVRLSHLGLDLVLFLVYLASLWLTLRGGWAVLARSTGSVRACFGGVALLASWYTLPVAGTSLMLADPYLTARSLTAPLVLFALAWAWDWQHRRRHGALAVAALLAAALLHPLMAGYGAVSAALLLAAGSDDRRIRRWGPLVLLAAGLLLAAVLQLRAQAESADSLRIASTRYYWFPFRWQWYEQLGLVAPLALLAALGKRTATASAVLARTATLLGLLAIAVAIPFCRASLLAYPVARLQPLRCYVVVYQLMTLLLGAWLAERLLPRHRVPWALLLLGCAALMGFVQRSTYPASLHLELPGRAPQNRYLQAFLWIRQNTPRDALFALDARYITANGEDAQSFRPIAERSALADYSKDGGEASITPGLTERWIAGQAAQTGLDTISDAERLRRLRPLGVTWVVLRASAATAWTCPFRNRAVAVCCLP